MSTDKTEQALSGWKLVPAWKLRRAAEILDRDGDEHGIAADLWSMLADAAPPAQQQSEPRSMPFLQCELIGDRPMVTVHQAQQYAKAYAAAATHPSLQEPQEAGRNASLSGCTQSARSDS